MAQAETKTADADVQDRSVRASQGRAHIDPMSVWVTARLAAWGREFALNREWPSRGVSTLWVLMHFGGVSPRGQGGRAPVLVDPAAWEIERIVADMYLERRVEASVLRAYYGGSGRQKVERREQAEHLARTRIGVREYFHAHDRGVAWVMGALAGAR